MKRASERLRLYAIIVCLCLAGLSRQAEDANQDDAAVSVKKAIAATMRRNFLDSHLFKNVAADGADRALTPLEVESSSTLMKSHLRSFQLEVQKKRAHSACGPDRITQSTKSGNFSDMLRLLHGASVHNQAVVRNITTFLNDTVSSKQTNSCMFFCISNSSFTYMLFHFKCLASDALVKLFEPRSRDDFEFIFDLVSYQIVSEACDVCLESASDDTNQITRLESTYFEERKNSAACQNDSSTDDVDDT